MLYPEDPAEIVRYRTSEVAQRFPKPQICLTETNTPSRTNTADKMTVREICTLRTDVSSRINEIGYNERRNDEHNYGEYSF